MPRVYTFRNITSRELGWHLDLLEGEAAGGYTEWFWLDGQLKDGYVFSMMLLGRRAKNGPNAEVRIMTPDGGVHVGSEVYPAESFKPEPFGATWSPNTFLRGKLKPNGMPEGYHLKVSAGDVGVDINAQTVATGVKFVDEEHGYTYYHPKKKSALGWWPLVSRAEVEGTLTIEGKPVKVSGLAYCERQVACLPLAPAEGGTSAQSLYFWGHFFAGDYTAAWTDSAASEHFKYRHFTPFVLWKGSDVVLSTFQFASYAEKFGIDSTGMPYPVVTSLKASDGITELTAQLLPGKMLARMGMLARQYCDVDVQIRHWGEVEEVKGTSVHEFCCAENWFPLKR